MPRHRARLDGTEPKVWSGDRAACEQDGKRAGGRKSQPLKHQVKGWALF